MIVDKLGNLERYTGCHKNIAAALTYIAEHANDPALEDGCYPIIPDEVIVHVLTKDTRPREAAQMEIHKRFMDIHYMIKGSEACGVAPLGEEIDYNHVAHTLSESTGINSLFTEPYNVLTSMDQMTEITDEAINTLLVFSNDATHEPALLQTPDYTPAATVNNVEYDAEHADRFTVDGITLSMETTFQMTHYHVNMAVLLQLGEWFDYLRENGAFDNTRIILVSDHGCWLYQINELIVGDDGDPFKDVEYYFPLLMVKDFNSQEFTTSDEFMTNADVPTIATNGLIESPVNPYTDNPITSDEKTAHDQFILLSEEWDTNINNGNTFIAGRWASVKDDIWTEENWSFTEGEFVLTEHVLPEN